MYKILAGILVAACAFGFMAPKEVLTIKGSDTMVILSQRWAELYMQKHPDVSIQVTGGGSGVGLSALINGTTDICNASRPMKRSESAKLKERYSSLGVEIKAARDGVTLYLHKDNPVKELSLEQVRKIYEGEVTNWKQVGGNDAKIILYGRENSSGTYVFFKDEVLKGNDFSPSMQSIPGTAGVVNAVAKDISGVGFGGVAYAKGVKYVKLKADANGTAYEPTEENIRSGNYPLSRYLFMYMRSRPSGVAKDFIQWVLSEEGQRVVTKVGYFPVK